MSHKISVDMDRLTEVYRLAVQALNKKQGIFYNGHRRFLPQFNLPPEVEFSPQRIGVKKPLEASQFLWTLSMIERRSKTSQNIRNGRRIWSNPSINWIFNQNEVARADENLLLAREVEKIFKEEFKYTLNETVENYIYSSKKLTVEYGGDPRNVIKGKTIKEARERLIGFRGIGTSIANLYILYSLDRELVDLIDPENSRLKVDIHKSRIPLNSSCIKGTPYIVRRDALVEMLEKGYHTICNNENISAQDLDIALWIIGSEVCVRKNYKSCVGLCPLESMCSVAYADLENKGFYTRVNDMRKGLGQTFLSFYSASKDSE